MRTGEPRSRRGLLTEDVLAFVRVGVHVPGEDERGGARFHGHPRHAEALFGRQPREVFAPHPLRHEHAPARVLWQHDRRSDEAEEVERRLEPVAVPRLLHVVELVEHLARHPVDHRTDVAVVEAAAQRPPRLDGAPRDHKAEVVLREHLQRVRPLHLNRDLPPLVRDRLVNLAERGSRHRLRSDLREEGGAAVAPLVLAHARGDGSLPAERLLDDGPREAVREGHVGRLQPLERGRRLVAHDVRPLRERLRDLDRHRAEGRHRLAEVPAAPKGSRPGKGTVDVPSLCCRVCICSGSLVWVGDTGM